MATDKAARQNTAKGPPSLRHRRLHIEDKSGDGHRLPANIMARLFEKNTAQIIGGGSNPNLSTSLTVPGYTVTTGGTADATAYSTTGGLLMTPASDDNFDMTLDSVLAVTPTAGKWYGCLSRITVSGATALGFRIGLTTGGSVAALPFGTDYTDQITISKAIASALVVGKVRGNSGTAADTGTLGTISTTEVEVGFCVYLHATAPIGFFSYKTAAADVPTFTELTSDQVTQAIAILTSPPTMYWTIHVTGITGTSPTLDVTSFIAAGDR